MNLEKLEQIARAAEKTANSALIAIAELQVENARAQQEIVLLKQQVEELAAQLNQQKASAVQEKSAALIDILAGFFQRGERISLEDWTEVRREVVADDDPDYGEVKKLFVKQGRELFNAVVVKNDEPTTSEVAPRAENDEGAATPAKVTPPKKRKMGGRVSTEVVRPVVDKLGGGEQEVLAPTFLDGAKEVDILPALKAIQDAGSLVRLPREELGRVSTELKTVFINSARPDECARAFKLVEGASSIPPTEKKQILQWLMESIPPTVVTGALESSSEFVQDAFRSIFF